MTDDPPLGLDAIARAAEEVGLALRGGFQLTPEEQAGLPVSARSVVLLGFVGAGQWPVFTASPEARDGQSHPLDRWSRRMVGALGARFEATPLFPFEGPPYFPFQAWAQRAEPVFRSPLGMLIHPTYGLSHSYRGALVFAESLEIPSRPAGQGPCERCEAKPCLTACPVGAFSLSGYDVDACAGWLKSTEGGECVSGGCLARRACPVGGEFAQSPEQARFHMRAFLAARP